MAITTVDELATALGSQFSRYYSVKNDPVAGNAIVGGFHGYFRSTGFPGAGATPTTTPVALNNLSTGAIPFMQQTSPATSYLGQLASSCTVSGATLEIHDRLVHMAGLSGSTTAVQTITGFDLNSFLATNNIGNRIGDANYSDVQWWLEWYINTGTTSSNITVNVTYNDGTTGSLTAVPTTATMRASRMLPLNSSIPAADSGKYIRAVNSIQLSASTTTAGSIGITATRYRASVRMPILNKSYSIMWAELGLPEIYNESCLFPICIAPATTMGNMRINGAIVHG